MAFTYTGDPTSNRDRMRFELGDTKEAAHIVSDEDIAMAVAQEPTDVLRAAALCAESLAARFARETSEHNAQVTFDHGAKQRHFEQLARKLRARAGVVSGIIGGRGDLGSSEVSSGSKFRLGMFDITPTAVNNKTSDAFSDPD